MAVIPKRARLFGEWQLRKLRDEARIVDVALEPVETGIKLSHRAVAVEAVGDAGRVPQQVFDRDRALRRLQVQRGLAGFVLSLDADLYVGEGWNVLGQGIVERNAPVFDQHHGGHRGDRLRHRIEPKYGIGAHRRLGRDVANTEVLEISRFAVLLDQDDGARNLPGRDLVAKEVADPLQFRARKLSRRDDWRLGQAGAGNVRGHQRDRTDEKR